MDSPSFYVKHKVVRNTMSKNETVETARPKKNKIVHYEAKMMRDKHFVGFYIPNLIIQQIWPQETEYARIEYDFEQDCMIISPWE